MSTIQSVWIITKVNYCFNNHGSVKGVFFDKQEGLKQLHKMLDTDYTKEPISTEDCISYGNGDTSISLLKRSLSVSKETNKNLYSDLWIVSYNHNYGVENPVKAIYNNEEEASTILESSDKKVFKVDPTIIHI